MKKKQKKCGRKSVSMRSNGKEQENRGLVFNFSMMINTADLVVITQGLLGMLLF